MAEERSELPLFRPLRAAKLATPILPRPSDFEEEPDAPFGLVDPNLQ
jgi:hypothetical protein